MSHLDLNPEQRATLVELLESSLSELSFEIADTDRMDFREGLKRKREVLKGIHDGLKSLDEPDRD